MRTTCLEFVERGVVGVADLGDPPAPEPGQVLIETKYSGVTNGTERHCLMSERGWGGSFPFRAGYQVVGQIAAVGEGVTRYEKGDWVYCGEWAGHPGWMMVSENALMIRLPDDIERKYCALFGVAGVALRGVRRMGVSAGDNVWVVGQGPIGHFTGQAARAAGAIVTVSDLKENRLEAARRGGAHRVLNAADQGYYVSALKEAGPYNYIFDCCGLEDLFFDIHKEGLLAFGGTIGAMAVRDKATFPWTMLHGGQAKIEVSCHFDPDDLRVLLHLYRNGVMRVEPMVRHVVSIDEAPMIYDKLAHNADDVLGVIFDWR